MSCKNILFFIFILSSLSGKAQTTISGLAPQWAGKTIQLYRETDPITRNRVSLSSDTINPDGSFELKSKNQNTTMLWMAVKRFTAPIFVAPGADYELSVVNKPENKLVDTWHKGSFEYGFHNLDSSDVNAMIGDFDNAYYNFYLDNVRYINSPVLRGKITAFEANYKPDSASEFVKVYRKSTFAAMKLSAGTAPLEIYQTYLQDRPFYPSNPAWYSFFDLFYADYFQKFDSRFGGATIANRIKTGMSPDSLSRLVDLDPFMANDTLKQWVLLKSVDQVYKNRAYSTAFLNRLVENIRTGAMTTKISETAQNLINKMDNPIIGLSLDSLAVNWQPKFRLPQNKLPTVIMVSASGQTESEKERILLQSLTAKYSEIFNWAEVQIDGTEIAEPQSRTVYRPVNDYAFLETFDIFGLPYFIWADAQGKIVETNIERPSEGLEKRLYKLKFQKEKENQIKVGQ